MSSPPSRFSKRRILGALGVFTGLLVAPLLPSLPAAAAYQGPVVVNFGNAAELGPAGGSTLSSSLITAMAVTPNGQGAWLAGANGSVTPYGSAPMKGSVANLNLQAPVVGMAATATGQGYWLAGLDGGIFAFGNAGYFGSMGGQPLNQPIVGMAPTPDGRGYWLVAADGGIFAFGDAAFYGSMGGQPLVAPVVGMAATPDGRGYWMVAADGGIFAFGDAGFYGSMGGQVLNDPVVGMAVTPGGGGYWLAGDDGGVFAFGDAPFLGSTAGQAIVTPVSEIVADPAAVGYWLLQPMNLNYQFPLNTSDTLPQSQSIVSTALGQVSWNYDTSQGPHCNPYGPCEEWCAFFATWVWEQQGIPIPSYPFVGDVYDWAADNSAVLSPNTVPAAGDAVLYGWGPENGNTAVHMGIVAEAWPDGAVVTVEGDAGPGAVGYGAVNINGPYLVSDSANYNGFPVFAFAQP
jgi:hypothetical protein